MYSKDKVIAKAKKRLEKCEIEIVETVTEYGMEVYLAFQMMLDILASGEDLFSIETVAVVIGHRTGKVHCFIEGYSKNSGRFITDLAEGKYDTLSLGFSDMAEEIETGIEYLDYDELMKAWKLFREELPKELITVKDEDYYIDYDYYDMEAPRNDEDDECFDEAQTSLMISWDD